MLITNDNHHHHPRLILPRVTTMLLVALSSTTRGTAQGFQILRHCDDSQCYPYSSSAPLGASLSLSAYHPNTSLGAGAGAVVDKSKSTTTMSSTTTASITAMAVTKLRRKIGFVLPRNFQHPAFLAEQQRHPRRHRGRIDQPDLVTLVDDVVDGDKRALESSSSSSSSTGKQHNTFHTSTSTIHNNDLIELHHSHETNAENKRRQTAHRFFSDSLIMMYHVSRQLLP